MKNFKTVLYISTGFWTPPTLYKVSEVSLDLFEGSLEKLFFSDNYKEHIEEIPNNGVVEYNQSEMTDLKQYVDYIYITE